MNLKEYQQKINEYRLPSYGPEAAVLGFLSEAGEVAGVFQKLMRGDYSPDIAATKLAKELGDVMWHVAAIANDNDWNIEDLLQENIDKLESRKIRNVILGSGDNR